MNPGSGSIHLARYSATWCSAPAAARRDRAAEARAPERRAQLRVRRAQVGEARRALRDDVGALENI